MSNLRLREKLFFLFHGILRLSLACHAERFLFGDLTAWGVRQCVAMNFIPAVRGQNFTSGRGRASFDPS